MRKTRQYPTPQPQLMLTNLNAFAEKWGVLTDTNGMSVFGTDTGHAINNLKKHITAGCLSNIPPGAGTNRNERFHHHVNALLHTSKMGILLAYALLTVVIHSYNSLHHRNSRVISEPITCSRFRHNTAVSPPLVPVGILPKERQQSAETSPALEINVAMCVIDLQKIKSILSLSFQKLQILRCVAQMGSVPLSNYVKCFVSYSASTPEFSQDSVCSEQSLIDHLNKNGLHFTSILGDGNCFFSAVAKNIRHSPDQWKPVLTKLKIDELTAEFDLTIAMRKAMVDELLGHQRLEYENFLGSLVPNYEQAVKHFLNPTFFDSPIGNAMPLALARAIQCSIVIFHSNISQPPTFISPVNVDCSATAFLVYNPNGSGHYDAALPVHTQATEVVHTKSFSCRCGSNKKNCKPLFL